MIKLNRSIFPLLAIALVSGACSRTPQATWYKGNLHTHTFWSDGNDFPEVVLSWYREHDYDFIALSDHNSIADTERWLDITHSSDRYRVYQNYVERFGDEWVESVEKPDTIRVRLKQYDEYAGLFNDPGEFLVIKSEEITDGFDGKPIHMNATNLIDFIAPQHGTSVVDVMQRNVDAVLQQRERTGQPMIPHINHPNYGWALTAEELAQVQGERFIEVYNGHPSVHNEGDSLRPSVERIWDLVNKARLAEGHPLLYGIGVDDSHHYQEMRVGRVNPGRGWIMVQADELTPASLIEALEAGKFYISTGVLLNDIRYDGRTLSIGIAPEPGVDYRIQFIGSLQNGSGDVKDADIGVILQETEAANSTYTIQGNELYVRAKVISSKLKPNPYREGEFERAWTQPVRPGS